MAAGPRGLGDRRHELPRQEGDRCLAARPRRGRQPRVQVSAVHLPARRLHAGRLGLLSQPRHHHGQVPMPMQWPLIGHHDHNSNTGLSGYNWIKRPQIVC